MSPEEPGRPQRAAVVAAVAALLVAGGVVDRAERPRPRVTGAAPDRSLMPAAAPPDALSSTWFCAGATAAPGGPAEGTVVIANPTTRPVQGSVAIVPTEGEARAVPVEVGPLAQASVPLTGPAPAPFASAVVDLDAGQVAVELVVRGPAGSDAAPCATTASDRWYFADGSTAKDATLHLSLFNPFPEDAIVDLSFSTDQGRAAPADFRPVVVPAASLVVTDIGSHVRRRNALATEAVARTGRVVAVQTQVRSAPGQAGLSLTLGAPSLGRGWHFPDGLVRDGVSERFSVANPSRREAKVLFEVVLDEGVAEPFERTVPARGRLDVVLDEEVGVPKGVGHATTVRSLDGVPVVVGRALAAGPPADRSGRADTLGARRAARRWVFPAGGPTDGVDEWLVLVNLGRTPATVSLSGLAAGQPLAIEGLQDLRITAGRRLAVRLGEHVKRDPLPVVVRSSQPIVVERAVFSTGGPGLWASMGIPLG